MTTTKRLLTADDVFNLPDDERFCELINGELIEMTPPGGERGDVQASVIEILRPFARDHGLGRVLGHVGIILTRDPDTVRAPEACFISRHRLSPGRTPERYLEIIPELIIEIVSPNDRASGILEKVQEWLRAGAQAVWVLYPKTRTIHVHRGPTDVQAFGPDDAITTAECLPGFSSPVARFFQ